MTSPPPLPVLRQLLNEATPGPWEWGPDTDDWGDCGPDLQTVAKAPPYPDGSVGPMTSVLGAWGHDAWGIYVEPADAALILAAVNNLPALLDLVERQAAAIEAVQELAAEWEAEAVQRTDRARALPTGRSYDAEAIRLTTAAKHQQRAADAITRLLSGITPTTEENTDER